MAEYQFFFEYRDQVVFNAFGHIHSVILNQSSEYSSFYSIVSGNHYKKVWLFFPLVLTRYSAVDWQFEISMKVAKKSNKKQD